MALRQEMQDGTLTISGLVRNPRGGVPQERLTAVVFFFDGQGGFLSSTRAPLDYRALAPGEESPFQLSAPAPAGVARYRVSFRRDEGAVVPHVDRRQQVQQSLHGQSDQHSDADRYGVPSYRQPGHGLSSGQPSHGQPASSRKRAGHDAVLHLRDRQRIGARSRTRTAAARAAAYAAASPFMLLIVLAAVMLVAALSAVTLVAEQRDPQRGDPQSREPQSREPQSRNQPRISRPQSSQPPEGGRFRFKTAVDLINVSATVTDASERFVTGLRKEDFILFEDEREQPITHFSDERVPVSLGIVLDTSGSMEGEKFRAAEHAIDRFMRELLSPDDEVFLMAFSDQVELISGWTTDRDRVMRGLRGVYPRGGTAMYDAVAEAIPLAQRGKHRKKAIVVISDGNDTNSTTDVRALRSLIRETEVLIYAVGIDGSEPKLA